MCLPVVGMGLSILGSAANMFQQVAYTSAYNSYQREISERNEEMAWRAATAQYAGIDDRLMEIKMQSGNEQKAVSADSINAQGRVSAAAASAGVAGRSVADLMEDFRRQEGEFISASEENERFAKAQAVRDKKAARLGLQSRLLNSVPNLLPQPNLLGQALGAFSGAFNTGLQIDHQVYNAGGNSLFF